MFSRSPAAELLVESSHEDDAEIDPVAGHDADEKPRRNVEVPDGKPREAKRFGETDRDCEAHGHENSEAHEKEKNDRQDRRHAERADMEQVVADLAVFGQPRDEIAGVADVQRADG